MTPRKRFSRLFGALIVAAIAFAAARAADAPAYEVPRSAVHEIRSGERAYRIFVATPPSYDRPENAGRRYPAIYLNDGDVFFLAAAGEPLLSYFNGVIEETIVVGVSYAVGEDPIESRQRDLTPVESENFAAKTGGAAQYLGMIENSIIPLVERAYRTDPERRTLAGHSFGATFGAFAMLTKPGLFANYILVSPALWYGDYAIAETESAYALTHGDLDARVYMAVGELEGPKGGLKARDMVNDEIAFAARLRSRNYESLALRDEVIGGANHAAAFPAAYLRALEWLFPAR